MFLYRNTEERYGDNINKEINMSFKNMSFYLLPDFHLFYLIVYLLKRPDSTYQAFATQKLWLLSLIEILLFKHLQHKVILKHLSLSSRYQLRIL